MKLRKVRASAPGSLMLMGEHAVLRGEPAVVCAIGKRIRVALSPREDGKVTMHSALGTHETTVEELAADESFRFVVGALRAERDAGEGGLGEGMDLDIRSEMSHQMGLGSSAAVTVATLAAVAAARGEEVDAGKLVERGTAVVRRAQGGRGSGADVAASAYGGVLRYYMESQEALRLPVKPELTLLYSGYKTPTAEVIARVEEARKRDTALYDALDGLIGETVRRAVDAAVAGDLETVGRMMDMNHGLMDALGVNDARLSELTYALRGDSQVLGSKISGSGLGDCAVGLGRALRRDFGAVRLDVEVDGRGAVAREDDA
ncbi:MAG: mevalonate kinase [Kiritimatiellae bacterium]|nr:mevalonate kinase [Kiritimatiellia bacterium]